MSETGKIPKAVRAAATAAYLAGPRPAVNLPARCTCSQHRFAHDAHVEEKAVFDYHRSLHVVKRKNAPSSGAPKTGQVVPAVRRNPTRGKPGRV